MAGEVTFGDAFGSRASESRGLNTYDGKAVGNLALRDYVSYPEEQVAGLVDSFILCRTRKFIMITTLGQVGAWSPI